MLRRNVKASSQVKSMVDVSIDPNKLDPIQYMGYCNTLMALKNIHQILSSIEIQSKSHTDIEKESNQYRFTCRLTSDVYDINASIVLTTSAGSIEDSSSELVKLVQDIETILDKG